MAEYFFGPILIREERPQMGGSGRMYIRISVFYKSYMLDGYTSKVGEQFPLLNDIISTSKEMSQMPFNRLPLFIGDTLAGKIAMRRLRDGI